MLAVFRLLFIRLFALLRSSVAENALGCMYEDGDHVVQSYDLAFKLFTKAAKKNDARAQCSGQLFLATELKVSQ